MQALLPLVLSSARRLVVKLLSVVLPVAGDQPVAQVAPVARPRRLRTVRTDALTVDEVHTVTFGLDGTSYEIELSAGQAAALRADLATWVRHARRTSGSTASRGTRRPTTATATGTTTIRSWARANGHDVSDRGRLPATVRQAYNAAH